MASDPATLEAELLRCQRWLDSPASTGKRVDGFSEVAWCRWAIGVIRESAVRIEAYDAAYRLAYSQHEAMSARIAQLERALAAALAASEKPLGKGRGVGE